MNNSGYYAAALNYRLCIKAIIFHAVVSRLHCLLCKAEISEILFVVFFFKIKSELKGEQVKVIEGL